MSGLSCVSALVFAFRIFERAEYCVFSGAKGRALYAFSSTAHKRSGKVCAVSILGLCIVGMVLVSSFGRSPDCDREFCGFRVVQV